MAKKRVIFSADMQRENRIPPGQAATEKWPVLHYGPVPDYSEIEFDFRVFGLVENPLRYNWEELQNLPRVEVHSDIHCVTTWSKLDNVWEGISIHDLLPHVGVKSEARFVIGHGEYGFTANLPIKDFMAEDVLLATHHNGEPLTPKHGFPLRLVVPQLYFWKSVKWLRALEFVSEDQSGFWERNGYHDHGDPWLEERMRQD